MIYGITLSLAWRNLWRQPWRTWLTVVAMVFSNTLLVFMVSLQFGMYRLMYENSLNMFHGHLQVQAEGYLDEPWMRFSVPGIAALASDLRTAVPEARVSARASAFVLVSSADRSYGVQLIGVQPDFEPAVSTLPGLIKAGRWLSGTAPEAVIGSVLARNLKVQPGDELTFFGSGRDGSFAAAVATVVGVFDSGAADIDRSLIEIPLAAFQDIFSMDGHGHSVVISMPDVFDLDPAKAAIRQSIDDAGLVLHHWDALQPGLRQTVQADMVGSWFMYAVLIALVAFSVLNTQLMSVLDRTREFGIVMALGLKPGRLGRLLLFETAIMAGLGLLLGVALGVAVVLYFQVYGFSYPGLEEAAARFNLPGRIYPSASFASVILGPLVVFAACLAAAVYPIAKLLRMQPVAAMQAA